MNWDTKGDEFYFNFEDVIVFVNSLPATKRSVLKASAKLFDPIGLLSPVIIGVKILFQMLCKEGVSWDQELEGPLLTKWKLFTRGLETLSQIKVPRYYHIHQHTPVTLQIHGFSDASDRAYAAVIYLRTVYNNGMVSTCILTSKTRVAPMKKQTTPRLELLGATILSRLVHNVQKVLPIQPQVYCWTDSLTVLCWIKNHHQWKQYVQIQVEEICKWVDRDNWRFCPGTENPADIPSRSCTSHELKSSELWWNGPGFLKGTCDRWPDMPTCHESETAKLELVKKPQEIVHSLVSVTNNDDQLLDLESVLEIKRYSTKVKLLRVTGTVLKFITLLRSNDRTRISQTLNGTDLNEAEILWIKSIQRSSFPEEYHQLKDGKSVIYKNQFKLFLNEHKVICCEGHLKNADIPTSTKCPVLLPTKHYFTELVIKGCHKTVHHNGISETLASLREKHWNFRGREAVKKIIRKCVVCRRYEGKAYTGQLIPDLPTERVSADPPFNNTGIDFAGPLYIHTAEAKESKAYVCIFTCASTRALHLEVTEGLSANTFLLAFRRFCSRRGIPSIILSDNAKTFKHCAKEIMKIIRSEEVHQYLSNKQITCTFIAEKAPWWGGVLGETGPKCKALFKKSSR